MWFLIATNAIHQTCISESKHRKELIKMTSSNLDAEQHNEELRRIVDDFIGVDEFMKYLTFLNLKHLLEFYLACTGLHTVSDDDLKLKSIIKAIYRQYLKHEETPWISNETKHTITEDLANKNYHKGIFDMAKIDTFTYLARSIYPKFVKSEFYTEHKKNMSRKNALSKSQSVSEHTLRKYNPLSFVRSLKLPSDNEAYSSLRASYRRNADWKSMIFSQKPKYHESTDEQLNVSVSEPTSTHYKNRPGSIHDNEAQSCSSGMKCTNIALANHLDETRSRSFLCGNDINFEDSVIKHHEDTIKNPEGRTRCILDQRPLSQTNPEVFASVLTAKLEALKNGAHSSRVNGSKNSITANNCNDNIEYVDETRILDEHCERVFKSGKVSPAQEVRTQEKLKKKTFSLSNESVKIPYHSFRDSRSLRLHLNTVKDRSPSEDSKLIRKDRYNRSVSKSKSALISSASHSKCSPLDSGILSLRSGPLSTNERVGEWLKSASKTVENDRSHSVILRSSDEEKTTVVYYLPGQEEVPYMTSVKSSQITLCTFKQIIQSKRLGNCRYFFKTKTDFSDCGVVFQEITDPDEVLPLFNNKVVAKVDRID